MTKELGREGILFASNFNFGVFIERIECDVMPILKQCGDKWEKTRRMLEDANTCFEYEKMEYSKILYTIKRLRLKNKNTNMTFCLFQFTFYTNLLLRNMTVQFVNDFTGGLIATFDMNINYQNGFIVTEICESGEIYKYHDITFDIKRNEKKVKHKKY